MKNTKKFLFFILIVFILSWLISKSAQSKRIMLEEKESVATIAGIEGEVNIKKSGGKLWQKAYLRMPVYSEDTIRTSKKSKVLILLLNTGEQIKCNEFTVITIRPSASHLKYKNKNILISFKITLGEAWADLTKNKVKEVLIQTPSVIAGIRGTQIDVRVDEDGKTTFTVIEGEVSLVNEFGSVILKGDQQSIIEAGRAPLPPQKVDVENFIYWIKDIRLNISITIPGRYENKKQKEKLKKKFEKMLKENQNHGMANLILGEIALDEGKLDAARAFLKKAGMSGIKNVRLYMGLADIEFLENKLDKASESYMKILKEFPPAYAPYTRLAGIELAKTNFKKAEKLYKKALQLNKKDTSSLIGLGICNMLKGSLKAAENFFQLCLKINPQNSIAHQNLGVLYDAMGKSDDSLKEQIAAWKLNPSNMEIIINLASAYARQKKYNLAENLLRKALKYANSKEKYSCYEALSNIYFLEGNFEESFNFELEAVKAKSDNTQALEKFAVISKIFILELFKKEKIDKAEKILKLASPYIKGSADYYLILGEFYYLKKDYRRALAALNTAISQGSSDGFAYYFLGITRLRLNNINEAKKNLLTAKNLFKKQKNYEQVKLIDMLLKKFE